MKAIGVCIIVGVSGIYAMENETKAESENKTILKHQPHPMDRSPQMKKIKTVDDILADPNKCREIPEQKSRRRSRSVESIDPLNNDFALLTLSSATLAIKELVPTNSIKKYRSMSDDQLKQSTSKLQLPNLSALTIKE